MFFQHYERKTSFLEDMGILEAINVFSKVFYTVFGLLWWLNGKESARQCRGHRFHPWSSKMPEEGNGHFSVLAWRTPWSLACYGL